jgi:hypothetical protein
VYAFRDTMLSKLSGIYLRLPGFLGLPFTLHIEFNM